MHPNACMFAAVGLLSILSEKIKIFFLLFDMEMRLETQEDFLLLPI